ncbi:MAG: PilZ domain-containing protein [Pelovirga sp.]
MSSILDHLSDYRVVRVVLPLPGEKQVQLDGVARTTTAPELEVNFLPEQFEPHPLDLEGLCRLSFEVAGVSRSIKAKILERSVPAKLRLEMVDSFTHLKKREYFRVDALLSVNYRPLDAARPAATSVRATVNISGGGLRLPVAEPLAEGTRLQVEIVMDAPESAVVECIGEVVGNYLQGGETYLALKFAEIDEEDQDAIIAYCLAEQRKQLRLKVQVLGDGDD